MSRIRSQSRSQSPSPSTIVSDAEHQTSIDNTLSIYIPRVFSNITDQRIKKIFHSLKLGNVNRVDFVARQSNSDNEMDPGKMAFIHFENWIESNCVRNLQEKILSPEKEARLVYDDPYYWILLPNTNPRTELQLLEERIDTKLALLEAMINSINNKTIYIYRGPPGIGKDYLASQHIYYDGKGVKFSTDDYFYEGNLESPVYNFNNELIADAHRWNQMRCLQAMCKNIGPIHITNTNSKGWEMKFYVEEGHRHGYEVHIIDLFSNLPIRSVLQVRRESFTDSDLDFLYENNVHNVPYDVIKRMCDNYEPDLTVEDILKMPYPERVQNQHLEDPVSDTKVLTALEDMSDKFSTLEESIHSMPSDESIWDKNKYVVYCEICSLQLDTLQTICPACSAPTQNMTDELRELLLSRPKDNSLWAVQQHITRVRTKLAHYTEKPKISDNDESDESEIDEQMKSLFDSTDEENEQVRTADSPVLENSEDNSQHVEINYNKSEVESVSSWWITSWR